MAWLTTSAPPTPDIEQDTQIPAKPDADAEALRRITSGQLHRWRPSVVLAHFMRILLVVPGHYVVLQFINPIVPPIAGLSLVPSRREMASPAGHNFSSQPEVPAPNDDDDDTPAMALSQPVTPISQPVEGSSRSARQAKAAAVMEQRREARGYLPPAKRGRR